MNSFPDVGIIPKVGMEVEVAKRNLDIIDLYKVWRD